jgi:hypothetical protein
MGRAVSGARHLVRTFRTQVPPHTIQGCVSVAGRRELQSCSSRHFHCPPRGCAPPRLTDTHTHTHNLFDKLAGPLRRDSNPRTHACLDVCLGMRCMPEQESWVATQKPLGLRRSAPQRVQQRSLCGHRARVALEGHGAERLRRRPAAPLQLRCTRAQSGRTRGKQSVRAHGTAPHRDLGVFRERAAAPHHVPDLVNAHRYGALKLRRCASVGKGEVGGPQSARARSAARSHRQQTRGRLLFAPRRARSRLGPSAAAPRSTAQRLHPREFSATTCTDLARARRAPAGDGSSSPTCSTFSLFRNRGQVCCFFNKRWPCRRVCAQARTTPRCRRRTRAIAA